MQRFFRFISSMSFTGILTVVLIFSMAIATFIESRQGTNVAWALVYDTWWFKGLFLLAIINLVGAMFRYKLVARRKFAVLLFHSSLIFMIVGAGITHFLSEEGMMRIREGSMSGSIVSDVTYMDVTLQMGEKEVHHSKKVRLSSRTPKKFKWHGEIVGRKVVIRSMDYIQNATAQYIASPGGQPYLQFMVLGGMQSGGGQSNAGLLSGEVSSFQGLKMSFNVMESGSDLAVYSNNDTLYAVSLFPVSITSMGSQEVVEIPAGETFILEQRKLLTVKGVRMALQGYMPSAKLQFVRSTGASGMRTGMDVTRLEVSVDGAVRPLYVQGMKNLVGEPATIDFGDMSVSCAYGSHEIMLPFVLRLKDFRVDRYPGSMSPSSFESDVILVDMERGINEERNIYMNNVLKHRGYRFYQSSYDEDELGTVLSVNKDFAGTTVTYIGYFLLGLGMLLALFMRGTRFAALVKSTANRQVSAVVIGMVMLFSGSLLQAQSYPAPPKEQAAEFGKLWVQGKEGRFKPMNTLSHEVMHKVIKESKFEGLSPDQVMLGMIIYPEEWKSAPIFEVDQAQIQELTGYRGDHLSFNDFVSGGRYLLSQYVNEAYNKQVQARTDFDKEVMKLDEKINVFYMVQTGDFLRIFPDKDHPNHKWMALSELLGEDAAMDTLAQAFIFYTRALREGEYGMAQELLEGISGFQERNSTHELNETKKRGEVFYNKVNLFDRLISLYGIFGVSLLILQFFRIFRPGKNVDRLFKIGVIHVVVAFALHTIFLGVRWYVSGHAPMSNGYESMIFVAWIAILAGLIFNRRTGFALSLTVVLAALFLLVAHMSWMNPDITNLVPVLKSPWLTIHVAVIMAGYAFLGMSMLMGMINLIFYSIINVRMKERLQNVIKQVTQVNHLSVIIGLYFLTIGTFLGGIWANESWGRYWGWDPKETWALISVLVYTFIVHMHRVPGLRGSYAFNLASMLGYFSILMTYFGVNYFLGGIHSYAGGASFTVPWFVYVIVLALLGLSIAAYRKQNALNNQYIES